VRSNPLSACLMPFRSIPVVLWAILQSSPSMSTNRAASYAQAIVSNTKKTGIDSLSVVSLIHHESSWRSSLISSDGEDIGLGQIRARFFGKCRSDPSPVKSPGKACRAVRARLKNGRYNIRLTIGALALWQRTCKKRTGTASLLSILMGYGGLSRPTQGQWCGLVRRRGAWRRVKTPWVVQRIIKRKHLLLRRLRACRGRCTAYRSALSKWTRLQKGKR